MSSDDKSDEKDDSEWDFKVDDDSGVISEQDDEEDDKWDPNLFDKYLRKDTGTNYSYYWPVTVVKKQTLIPAASTKSCAMLQKLRSTLFVTPYLTLRKWFNDDCDT